MLTKSLLEGYSAGAATECIMELLIQIYLYISVGAGLEYKAATICDSAYTAMSSGGPNPIQQGDLAYSAMEIINEWFQLFCFMDEAELHCCL